MDMRIPTCRVGDTGVLYVDVDESLGCSQPAVVVSVYDDQTPGHYLVVLTFLHFNEPYMQNRITKFGHISLAELWGRLFFERLLGQPKLRLPLADNLRPLSWRHSRVVCTDRDEAANQRLFDAIDAVIRGLCIHSQIGKYGIGVMVQSGGSLLAAHTAIPELNVVLSTMGYRQDYLGIYLGTYLNQSMYANLAQTYDIDDLAETIVYHWRELISDDQNWSGQEVIACNGRDGAYITVTLPAGIRNRQIVRLINKLVCEPTGIECIDGWLPLDYTAIDKRLPRPRQA